MTGLCNLACGNYIEKRLKILATSALYAVIRDLRVIENAEPVYYFIFEMTSLGKLVGVDDSRKGPKTLKLSIPDVSWQ